MTTALGGHALGHAGEPDDVGEENGDRLAPHRAQRLVAFGEQRHEVRREIAGKIGAGALGGGAPALEVLEAGDVREGFADRDFEVTHVDRLRDEIKGTAVHRRPDVGHVAIGGDDDRPHLGLLLVQPCEKRQPVHDRHVDVEEKKLDIGLCGEDRERLLAVTREAEGVLPVADLAAEALAEQQLEIGLVIDGEDFRGAHRRRLTAENARPAQRAPGARNPLLRRSFTVSQPGDAAAVPSSDAAGCAGYPFAPFGNPWHPQGELLAACCIAVGALPY